MQQGFPQTPGSLRGSDWNSKLWPSPSGGPGSAGRSISITARAVPERSQSQKKGQQHAPAGSMPTSSRRITARSAIAAASLLLLLCLLVLAAALSGNMGSVLGGLAATSPWVHHAAEGTTFPTPWPNTSHLLRGSEEEHSNAAGMPESDKALVRLCCSVHSRSRARVLVSLM